jgi:murein DD-endopeptidase MepM/ murein hydrolase activator NlpD
MGAVFSAAVMLVAYNFFDSPKEKQLRREVEQYKLEYEILNSHLDNVQAVLKDVENRDDNIYRVIFEAEPIPNEVRNAGIGGADRYEKLKGYDNSDLIIETTKKMDKISRMLYVQSKSFDEVFKMAKSKEKLMLNLPAILPLPKNKGQIISGFGLRFHPILKYRRMHTGIDIAAPKGTPIYATGDGVIAKSGRESGYGLTCIINHGFGYQTLYGHMSSIRVREGQKVKRGEVIGYVGSTGLSKAPHVHYEVILNGNKVNPVFFFYNDLSPDEYENVIDKANEENQCLS